jgi:hypothetical protein
MPASGPQIIFGVRRGCLLLPIPEQCDPVRPVPPDQTAYPSAACAGLSPAPMLATACPCLLIRAQPAPVTRATCHAIPGLHRAHARQPLIGCSHVRAACKWCFRQAIRQLLGDCMSRDARERPSFRSIIDRIRAMQAPDLEPGSPGRPAHHHCPALPSSVRRMLGRRWIAFGRFCDRRAAPLRGRHARDASAPPHLSVARAGAGEPCRSSSVAASAGRTERAHDRYDHGLNAPLHSLRAARGFAASHCLTEDRASWKSDLEAK